MKYFTFGEILLATLSFFVSGAVLGTLRQSIQYVLLVFKNALLKYYKIVYSALHFHWKNKIFRKKKSRKKQVSVPWRELWHLFFTLVFGTGYLLCSYLFVDGTFRVYFILVMLVGFWLSDRYIGRYFLNALEWILKILTYVVARLISPIISLVRGVIRVCKSGCRKKRKTV